MSVVLAPQYTRREYRWTEWKTVRTSKAFVYQYDDNGSEYTIWGYDGPEVHVCQIFKGSVPENALALYSQGQNNTDKTDFVNNFLSNANQPINVTTITGATDLTKIGNVGDRLKVDPGSIAISPPRISKKMRAIFDAADQTVTGSSFTTIYTYNGSGDFWGCMIDTTLNGAKIRIEIDGEVIVDGSATITDIQYSQSLLTNQNYAGGMWYSSMDFGDFGFSLPRPISFTSSVVIKLKRDNNGSVTVNQKWVYITQET